MRSARTSVTRIPLGDVTLVAELTTVTRPKGTVIFAGAVAPGDGAAFGPAPGGLDGQLARRGIESVRLGLRSAAEAPGASAAPPEPAALVARLCGATEWALANPDLGGHPIGFFGVGEGAVVALLAAAARPDLVAALVCGDIRPELVGEALGRVQAPTLVIAEGSDGPTFERDREALRRMRARHAELAIVPGVADLGEAAARDAVAELAVTWFERYLVEAMSDASGIEAV